MKKNYLLRMLACTFLMTCQTAFAQVPAYFNYSATGSVNAFPFSTAAGKAIQWLVAPGELPGAFPGNIVTVYFKCAAATTGTTWNNLTIKMGQTPATTLVATTWITTGMTQVYYNATVPINVAIGSWFSFQLTTPFLYDPSQSLIIEVSQTSVTGGAGPQQGNTTVAGSIRRVYANVAGTPVGGDGSMGHLGIDMVPATPCVAPPTAGTTTISNANPCATQPFVLNLSGNSVGGGQTFQWQTSPNLGGPYTNIGSAQLTSYFTTSTTATAYYRCEVTCGASSVISLPVLATVPALFPGGTYTINNAVPTGGTNFQTFSDAAAAINCGITSSIIFNVSPGTYANDRFLLDSFVSNVATNTITVNGNGATLSYLSANPGEPGIIKLNGTKHVTINNLNIEGISALTTNYAWGIFLTNNADSNTITNCKITLDTTATSTNYSCVVLSGGVAGQTTVGSGCDGNLISNCVFKGGYYCMTLMGNSGVGVLQRNTITNNIFKDFYVYGIYASYSNNMIIEGNDISRPSRTAITTFGPIYMITGHARLTVSKNRIHDPATSAPAASFTGYGVYLSGAATATNENIISNNLIYNWQGAGTGIHYGFYNTTSGYSRYYYNTISFDYTPSTTTAVTYGFYQTGAITASTIEFKNNNVSITRGGATAKYGIYHATAANVIVSNNNNYYINGAGGSNFVGFKTAAQASLANWQTASSQDLNSQAIDPMFVNASLLNFMPTNVALDNTGTPISILTDISGASRDPITPDPGVYEFAVPPCANTPTAGTASGPSGACNGTSVTLNLIGYSIASGISIQWESSPAGLGTWSQVGGGTFPTLITNQTGATDYRAVVTCSAGGGFANSNVVTVAANPFYLCYCSPFTGTVLHTTTANYMTNVNITGTPLNNTTGVAGPGGYMRADHAIPTNTATLSQTTPYTLNVAVANANYIVEAWIDFDQSGTYDQSEYTLLTNSGTVAIGVITIPGFALTGLTGLRVRVYQTTGYGSAGPCTSITTGYETEEYIVTITTPPACQQPSGLMAANITSINADVSWSPVAGAALGYDWAVDQTSTPAPGGSTIINSTSSTTPPTVTGLTSSNTYYLHVRSNCGGSSYSLWSVYAFSTPPPNDDCLNAVDITNGQIYNGTTTGATQTQAPCMTGTTVANDVWYSFTTGSIGGSVTVTVVTTGLMDVVIEALSGACGGLTGMVPTASTTLSGTCIDGPAAGAEFGTYTVSAFTTYYVRVYGFVSAQGVFTIQATGAPLSIKLKDINAVNVGVRNRVNWTTADEIKGDKFIVERSRDGNNYIPLATINAKGQPAGYTYWDETPLTGVNHYRLKLIDVAGGLSYSKSVTATVKGNGTLSVEAFPNPVSDLLSVRAYGTLASEASIVVTDITGKTISSHTMKNGTVDIGMKGLTSGIYLVRYSDDIQTNTIKVNKK